MLQCGEAGEVDGAQTVLRLQCWESGGARTVRWEARAGEADGQTGLLCGEANGARTGLRCWEADGARTVLRCWEADGARTVREADGARTVLRCGRRTGRGRCCGAGGGWSADGAVVRSGRGGGARTVLLCWEASGARNARA